MTHKCGLIGFPDDVGVRNNNGRPGASGGPYAFREMFRKPKGFHDTLSVISDEGNCEVNVHDIVESHQSAAKMVEKAQREFGCTIVIGGGHDYAFPHLSGIKKALEGKRIGCINIDPHFDLRKNDPHILSGSPFYQAIEGGVIEGKNLVEFGIQRHCNGKNLWDYAREKEVVICPMEDLRQGKAVKKFRKMLKKLAENCDAIVVSLDLDSIPAAFAPGVSAPASEGFYPSELLEMIRAAAKEEKVASLGIYELNPLFDIDGRTARLASVITYHFLDFRFFD